MLHRYKDTSGRDEMKPNAYRNKDGDIIALRDLNRYEIVILVQSFTDPKLQKLYDDLVESTDDFDEKLEKFAKEYNKDKKWSKDKTHQLEKLTEDPRISERIKAKVQRK